MMQIISSYFSPILSTRTHARRLSDFGLLLVIVSALCLALYPLVRYGGYWGETDTSTFTWVSTNIQNTKQLVPAENVYPNGYGYQALLLFFSSMSGLAITDLQIYASPLLFLWLVVPAWLLYRELTDSDTVALLATVMLFVQPEFLFPTLRGTHEKFTRGLMLLCMYVFVKSLRERGNIARFTGFVLTFYLCIYSVIAFNNLFATSFMMALGLSLLLISFFMRKSSIISPEPVLTRLYYVILISVILAVIFTFYAYAPASHSLQLFQSVWERIVVLFLNIDAPAFNPYTTVDSAWVNLPTYFVLSIADWLLLGTSACIWLWQSTRWWFRKWEPEAMHELMLWSLYGAFSILGAISIVVDFSGAISGNLQHRVFPSFVMVAAPVVAVWLANRETLKSNRLSQVLLSALIAFLAVVSISKATNEPLFSNKWIFVSPDELQAVQWAGAFLPDRTLWTGYDERVSVSVIMRNGELLENVNLTNSSTSESANDVLVSEIILRRGERLRRTPPLEFDSFITYDNGTTQIYHQRPQSPYQP